MHSEKCGNSTQSQLLPANDSLLIETLKFSCIMAPSQFIYHQFNASLKWFPIPYGERGAVRAALILVFGLKIGDLAHRSKCSDLYFCICKDKRHRATESQVLLVPVFRRQSFQHKPKMYEHSIVHTFLVSLNDATYF